MYDRSLPLHIIICLFLLVQMESCNLIIWPQKELIRTHASEQLKHAPQRSVGGGVVTPLLTTHVREMF